MDKALKSRFIPYLLAFFCILVRGLCSALGYDFWKRAVPVLGPSTINTLIYFIPLVGVAGGIIFLDEPLTLNLLIGGAMISCGVLLARRG